MEDVLAGLNFLPDEIALEAEESRRSLRTFVEAAWHIIEPSMLFVGNWHIDAMCEHLQAGSQGQIQLLMINVPPGAMKSIAVSVMWPVWDWIDNPWRRFLTASYIRDLSARDSWRSRLVIQSPWFQRRWANSFSLTGDKNKITNYANDRMGHRLATSVSGATGERAQVRILDDPHNIEGESDEVREATVQWTRSVWSERGADPMTDIQVVVMQRVHERDVCGYYLDENELWKKNVVHLKLPMRFDTKRRCMTQLGFKDPRTTEREILFPVRWPEEVVRHKESNLGEYGTAAQLQQEPAPPGGGILKRHWWRFWHYPGQQLPPVPVPQDDGSMEMVQAVPLPYRFDIEILSWDMSFKNMDTSDFVVGLHMAKAGPDTYIRNHRRGRMSFTQSVEEVKDLSAEAPDAGAKLVEDAANGPALIDTLRATVPGMIPVPTAGGKDARAQSGAVFLEAGNMYLPHPQLFPWVEPFIQECQMFNKGRHDDQVDAWSHGTKYLYTDAEQGIQITPEYDPKIHRSQEPMRRVPGYGSFRFWYVDYWMCCIIGQVMPRGQIVVYDCILEANISIEELIEWRLQPILNERYKGCTDWRDIWNRAMPTATSPESDHSLLAVVGDKLGGQVEVGEPKFEQRVESIKSILRQVNRFIVNRTDASHVHDALNGRYMYPVGPDGLPRRDGCLRKHPGSAVGEALGHGLARMFIRRPAPPVRDKKGARDRATSYAVE